MFLLPAPIPGRAKSGRKHSNGFTLIELLVTISITTILMCAAAPTMSQIAVRSKRDAESAQLAMAIQRARSEAIRRNEIIGLCPRGDGLNCASGSIWNEGWVLFMDINHSRGFDPEDRTIAVDNEPAKGMDIRSTRAGALFFYPDGRSAGSNTTLTLCPRDKSVASQAIVLNNGGRVRSENYIHREGCA